MKTTHILTAILALLASAQLLHAKIADDLPPPPPKPAPFSVPAANDLLAAIDTMMAKLIAAADEAIAKNDPSILKKAEAEAEAENSPLDDEKIAAIAAKLPGGEKKRFEEHIKAVQMRGMIIDMAASLAFDEARKEARATSKRTFTEKGITYTERVFTEDNGDIVTEKIHTRADGAIVIDALAKRPDGSTQASQSVRHNAKSIAAANAGSFSTPAANNAINRVQDILAKYTADTEEALAKGDPKLLEKATDSVGSSMFFLGSQLDAARDSLSGDEQKRFMEHVESLGARLASIRASAKAAMEKAPKKGIVLPEKNFPSPVFRHSEFNDYIKELDAQVDEYIRLAGEALQTGDKTRFHAFEEKFNASGIKSLDKLADTMKAVKSRGGDITRDESNVINNYRNDQIDRLWDASSAVNMPPAARRPMSPPKTTAEAVARVAPAAFTTPPSTSGRGTGGEGLPQANAAPPRITAQPQNVTIAPGQTATFTIAATGNPAPAYQWQVYMNAKWLGLKNATSSTFEIANAKAASNGDQLRCIVTNPHGTVTSAVATLTVTAAAAPAVPLPSTSGRGAGGEGLPQANTRAPGAPVITAHPANVTAEERQTLTFTVAATGNPAPAYQWQQSRDKGADWLDLPERGYAKNVTTATLTLSGISRGLTGSQYRCVIKNDKGAVTSNPATLTVTYLDEASIPPAPGSPVITRQPADVSTTEGQPAVFTVAATSNSPITYKWQYAGREGVIFYDLNEGPSFRGVATATLTMPAPKRVGSGYKYRCVIKNASGTVVTTPATLTTR